MPKKNLKVCGTCGLLFDCREYMEQCDACLHEDMRVYDLIESAIEEDGVKTAKDIAKFTQLPLAVVKRVVRSSRVLSRDVDLGDVCKRCEKRSAVARLQYCGICLLHIQTELYATVEDLNDKRKRQPARPTARLQRMAVHETVGKKRKRTGTYRFDPSPRPVKGSGR